jgi:hypothetical protein
MSDWHEANEVQEQDASQETTSEQLSPVGISAVQGDVQGQDEAPSQPDDTDGLLTIHPRKNLETLPSPEVEPITIKDPEGNTEEPEGQEEGSEGRIQPPPGWQPGGPERGW